MKNVLLCLLFLLIFSCEKASPVFDLQGHRGARGMYPENSIPGFIYAIDQGVNTLELDLCVTKDHQLVVSHEPVISAEICFDTTENAIPDSLQMEYNIFKMTYDEVRQFDCGSKGHHRFPNQTKISVNKPLLTDVIDTIAHYLKKKKKQSINYNIEIKSKEKFDSLFHPSPKVFSDLVYHHIDQKLNWENVTIQSFDFRVLQYIHETYPHVRLALLIENDLEIKENIDSLGFTPDIYSCYYVLLSQKSVDKCHQLGMKVVPWTVNDAETMKRLISWELDGLITDYPNIFKDSVETM